LSDKGNRYKAPQAFIDFILELFLARIPEQEKTDQAEILLYQFLNNIREYYAIHPMLFTFARILQLVYKYENKVWL
jgi:hypothetical protein